MDHGKKEDRMLEMAAAQARLQKQDNTQAPREVGSSLPW